MSAILLSNPFAGPPLPSTAPAPPGEAQTAQAVAPVAAGMAGNDAGSATSHSGSGAGHGSGDSQISRYLRMRGAGDIPTNPPQDATRNSVVEAQAQAATDAQGPLENNLPKVEMPDPLPTSPLLMALREGR